MPRSALEKIWTTLGGLLFAYAFNSISLSQGGPAISALTIDDRPVVLSIYAIVGLSSLLILQCLTGVQYAGSVGRNAWYDRLPLLGSMAGDPIDRNASFTKVILVLTLTTFVLLPTYAIGHHWRKIVNHGVVFSKSIKCETVRFPATLPIVGTDRGRRISVSQGPLRITGSEFDAARAQDCPSPLPRGPRDLSPACEKNKRDCFGSSWTRLTYPGGLILLMFVAGFMVLWLIVRVFCWSVKGAWRRRSS